MTKLWLNNRHSAYRRPSPVIVQKSSHEEQWEKERDEARVKIAELEIEEWTLGWLKLGIMDADKERPLTNEEIEAKRKMLIKKRKALEARYGISN